MTRSEWSRRVHQDILLVMVNIDEVAAGVGPVAGTTSELLKLSAIADWMRGLEVEAVASPKCSGG